MRAPRGRAGAAAALTSDLYDAYMAARGDDPTPRGFKTSADIVLGAAGYFASGPWGINRLSTSVRANHHGRLHDQRTTARPAACRIEHARR